MPAEGLRLGGLAGLHPVSVTASVVPGFGRRVLGFWGPVSGLFRPPGWPRPVVLVALGVWVWGAVGWPPSSARVELGCAGGSPLRSGTFLDRAFSIIGTGAAGDRAALPADEEQRVREHDAPRRGDTAGNRAAAPRRGVVILVLPCVERLGDYAPCRPVLRCGLVLAGSGSARHPSFLGRWAGSLRPAWSPGASRGLVGGRAFPLIALRGGRSSA